MSTSTAQPLRCPRCSATMRAGTEWCSLCYADLRPRERAVAQPPATPDLPLAQPVDLSASALPPLPDPGATEPSAPAAPSAVPRRSAGKHAKEPVFGAVTAPDTAEVDRLADQLLAELAATEGGSPLGAASGLVDSTAKRAALMIGGGLGIVLLLVALMAVAGAVL